ncbi:substrate-binding domain-containing protein [Mesorhizobium sp. BAC0120]|uniref:sugar ABC transporter substrate-binding protein n=1 Tax=Mesorhizobium sp. BAC0120 TaxID=3090670 RepID=UPI00298C0D7D|nr:substrate-binding domain-containing protein [Mesorhizobium sp. BAC0120]MDW6025425.1 substrate-binding domain-containing protein [Mesorhizobium sp. BAC0120]
MSRLQSTFLAASLLAVSAAAGIGQAAADGPVIAFLMPCSTCADRFEGQDKPLFIAAVKALDPSATVIANNAQGSAETQVSQAEAALTNGAKVIVVSPLTEAAGAAIVDKAQSQGVPVLSYDGLLTGAPADFFVSFQNKKVGELQGKFLADKLPQGSTIALINGSQDIAPGREFKAGAHEAVDPVVQSGKLVLGYEADIPQFDPAKAQAAMEQGLTSLDDKVDAVLVANDGMAGAVIAALTARNLNGKVLVTGQDATDAGLQRILAGDQTMSVYKAIKAEAEAAAKAALLLAAGKKDEVAALATTEVDNGAGKVPSILLDPVVVTRENIKETVIADGFTTRERICVEAAAAAAECK